MHRGKRVRTWIVAALVAGTAATWLATTFVGSAAGAPAATVGWTVVSGAAFTPDDNTCAYDRGNYSGEITSTGGCVLEAGVQLPHGATVTRVEASYDGNGTGASIHLEENDGFGGHDDMASFSVNDCNPGLFPCTGHDGTISTPDVDNQSKSYGIWVSPGGSGFTLYKVSIRYTSGGAASGAVTAGTSVNPGS